VSGARAEMGVVDERGGAAEAVPYMKTRLVESHRERVRRIEAGELCVVGQNCYVEAEPSPLQEGEDGGILRVDPAVERSTVAALESWRSARDGAAVERALKALGEAAEDPDVGLMPFTLAAARAGATTGEWAGALRAVFGSYRAPTGVGDAAAAPADDAALAALRDRVERVSEALGRRIKILVGKPGLDGHSNGAEQIAVRARDAGMDVVYDGIRLTPARIARTALDEGVHVVGLSILSGSHASLIPAVLRELSDAGASVPVVVGGIIPPADEAALREAGVARVYTPKDFEVSRIMGDIVDLVAEHHGVAAIS
jgi:ethylmalonyl-CoA mutase